MKLYILYNLNSPAERWAENLQKHLTAEKVEVQMMNADSREGASIAEVFDVMARPAIILTRDDGSPKHIWQGMEQIPLISELTYLARTA